MIYVSNGALTSLYVKSKFHLAEKRVGVVGTVTSFTSSNYCQAGARYRGRQLHDYIDEINDFVRVIPARSVPTQPVYVYPKSVNQYVRCAKSAAHDISCYFTIKNASGIIANTNSAKLNEKCCNVFQCNNKIKLNFQKIMYYY